MPLSDVFEIRAGVQERYADVSVLFHWQLRLHPESISLIERLRRRFILTYRETFPKNFPNRVQVTHLCDQENQQEPVE